MKTLFIDTHLNDIIVLLLENGKVVDKRKVINKKNNSEFMFPAIKEILDKNCIDEIIVVNGPGSFTGVRLGVTIAKTLAYTLNKPIKTISALKVMTISTGNKLVAIDDNNGYYLGCFDDNYNEVEDYKYVGKKELVDIDKYNLNYTIDAEKLWNYMKNVEAINPHMVNPIYIKKIGVEIDKNSK